MKVDSADLKVEVSGVRLDAYLADRLADTSRTVVQSLIRNGRVGVNSKIIAKPSFELHSGESLSWPRARNAGSGGYRLCPGT